MEFRLLGPLEVVADGRVVPIGSVQQRAILVTLLLARDAVVSSGELLDVVWGEHPPASADSTLRGLVWRLRKQLPGADVGRHGDGYRLVAGDDAVDARRFERLIAEGRRAAEEDRAETVVSVLETALALWRGPALGEFASWPFAQADAARLDEGYLAAVEDLAEAELALGRVASAVARLEPVVRNWPLRERAVGALMLGLYRSGRQADALAAYRRLRHTLAEELGVEPTPALRRLEAAILRQSDELLPRPSPSVPSPPLDRPRDNLPTALTPFVGRAAEQAEVQALLATSRLVTLTGPGGVGKTRLAVEVAAAVRDKFPDGVWFADLTAVSERALVAPAIAAGVGLLVGELAQAEGGVGAALAERLRSRRLLVVLDNCEQVVDSAAAAVHDLLRACPGLVVLATSREALAVTGEVVFSVPPLSLPAGDPGPADDGGADSLLRFDAVALFCARAQAADRTFALSPANAEAVVRICRRLDGLPLALELAAARARVLGTAELARQLHDRFAALGEGPRTAPARQQTLRAALAWSHDLLSPVEQTVLHRLAVFPATFDLDAVRAVAGPDAVAPFTRLVDKSLVTVISDESRVRYQLLESVRAYAFEQLSAAGEVAAAQRSHRDAFLTLARALVADDEGWLTAGHFRRLDADYVNFMAALEWSWANGDDEEAVWISAALMMCWILSGHPEGCDWMERAAAVPVSSPAMVRPATLARGGLAVLLRNFRGDDRERPTALIAEAIAVADAGDDPYARAFARIRAIDHAVVTGHLDEAREHLRRGEAVFRAVGGRTEAVYELGWAMLALATGDTDAAARALERPLERLSTATDTYLLPMAQGNAALIRARAGDPTALELATEAVAATRRFPVPQAVVMALARAVEAAVLLGRTDEARPLLIDLVDGLRQLGARRWVAEAEELAAIVLAEDQPETAAVAVGAAERLRSALGEPAGPAFVLAGALEAAVDGIGAALGPAELSSRRARGAALPVDEALAMLATGLRHGG
jgi:predicted ATPase/DNA-binding SARP family transcriptional activator